MNGGTGSFGVGVSIFCWTNSIHQVEPMHTFGNKNSFSIRVIHRTIFDTHGAHIYFIRAHLVLVEPIQQFLTLVGPKFSYNSSCGVGRIHGCP